MKSRIAKEKFTMPEDLTEEKLTSERDFVSYVRMLKYFAKKYCVIIAMRDTPCGPDYTPTISKEVMDIGLNIDLYNKFRCPYVAIIDEGTLLFEKLELNVSKNLEVNLKLDTNDKIEVVSASYNDLNE